MLGLCDSPHAEGTGCYSCCAPGADLAGLLAADWGGQGFLQQAGGGRPAMLLGNALELPSSPSGTSLQAWWVERMP